MKKTISSCIKFLFVILLILAVISCGSQNNKETSDPDSIESSSGNESAGTAENGSAFKEITGTQTIMIKGFDWGPAVTKTVIHLDAALKNDNIDKEAFSVVEKKQGVISLTSSDRTVKDVYLSDETGNKTGNDSEYLALELSYSPEEGSPFNFNLATFMNEWSSVYQLEIVLKEGMNLTAAGGESCILNIDPVTDFQKAVMPELEGVVTDGLFKGSHHELTYAYFKPENASEESKRPLVIWLHGMGEGGKDPKIALFGNRVSKLFSKEFQETLNGCYILVPQTETYWMQYTETGDWANNNGNDSIYLNDLKELIDQFVSENAVDPEKIIIGGCSNGGFMTMDMLFNYPDYFAAAYPICEAFKAEGITDEMIEKIKDIPIWFIYAKNDTTVLPDAYEKPLIDKLKQAGAKDLHVSEFEDVHDTSGEFKTSSGSPYQYQGHWSWIYFFNNECQDGDLSVFDWMSELVNE